jgi:tellurite resistance protein
MNTLARLAATLLAATLLAAPLPALAEGKAPAPKAAAEQFPMKADRFKKLTDAKLSHMKRHLDHALSKRSLTAAQRGDIEKSADAAAKQIQTAVAKASSDGVVTGEEAKQIRALGEQLRGKIQGELKGKHANAKPKGDKPKGKAAPKAAKPKK